MPVNMIGTKNTTSADNAEGIRVKDPNLRVVDNELGKDAFLQILVAQMANQDPLSPTSDTEFIAQMAQFSALEQMQNMNTAMQTQMTYSFMGKDVTANFAVDAEGNPYRVDVYGKVQGVANLGGVDFLTVQNYKDGEIYLVSPDKVTNTLRDTTLEDKLSALLALLGQVVANTAPPKNDDTEETPETPGEGEGEGESGDKPVGEA